MEEKTATDILIENLTKRGITSQTHKSEKQFYFNPSDRFLNTKYVIAEFDSCFFCAFDSFAAKAYTSNTYTGIYSELVSHNLVECNIYRKDWIDTFLRLNKIKTSVKYIDEKLTITSRSRYNPSNLLSEKDVETFLEINQSINPLKILIQKDYPPILSHLENKLMVGLETDIWLYKETELDLFLTKGLNLIKRIKDASA